MEALQETLRPLLKPITSNLPGPLDELAVSLLGPRCHASLVRELTLTDDACLKLAVSKALGLGIVGASSIVKVPQILKLLNSKSASGVSVLSYLLETAAYVVTLAYNFRNEFPFSTYGETALIAAQNVVITTLVFNYSGRSSLAAVFVAILAAAAAALLSEQLLDLKQLTLLQAGAGALGVASKIPQILTIWQQGSTGQLSAFTVSPSPCPFACLPSLTISPPGHQLPPRLPRPRLHHPPGGRRQPDPV
jgi:mannose-P-dolichol utilization defect protein 1